MRRLVQGILLLSLFSGNIQVSAQETNKKPRLDSLAQYIHHVRYTERPNAPRTFALTFFLRFVDFGCAACLNNFLDFCDVLNSEMARKGEREILMIFLRDETTERHQLTTLKKWAKVNNLPYPVYLASQKVFDSRNITHSLVVVIDKFDEVYFYEELPLSSEAAGIILHQLFSGN